MHISEAIYKLKQLEPDTQLSAAHLIGLLEALTPMLEAKTAPQPASSSIEDLQLIDEKQVAKIMDVSVETVQYWRKMKVGPPVFKDKNRKAVRYNVGLLKEYINKNTTYSRFANYPESKPFHFPIMLHGVNEIFFFDSINRDDEPTGYKLYEFPYEPVLSEETEQKIKAILDETEGVKDE